MIEKCLEHNTTDMNRLMVEGFIKERGEYFNLLIDQYGNYVIQKCLSVAVEPEFSKFINVLKSDVEQLGQSSDFGVKIYQRLVRKYPQLSSDKVQMNHHNSPSKNQTRQNN